MKAIYYPETRRIEIEAGSYRQEINARAIEGAWRGTSFHEERRAEQALAWLAEQLAETFGKIAELAAKAEAPIDAEEEAAEFARRLVDLHRTYWNRNGQCVSSMIAGPSNFPVRRQQKRHDSAMKAHSECLAHPAIALKAVKRRAFPYGAPGEAIRSNNPAAEELIEEKIAKLEAGQAQRKAINALWRKAGKPGAAEEDQPKWDRFCNAVIHDFPELGGTGAAAIMRGCLGHYMAPRVAVPPYEGYELSNPNAEIRRLKQRLEALRRENERATETDDQEHETRAGAVTYREDADAARVQLIFEGKPAPDVRAVLKGRGFRWSPRAGAWQRHLNANGRAAARQVLEAIKEGAAA